jgi:uncharacterized NAD-dependent epimerase/dehydratase family protein
MIDTSDSEPIIHPEARVAILAHDHFPGRAKTAIGLLKYAPYNVVSLIDRETAGGYTDTYRDDLPRVPVVESMAAAPPVDVLAIGISPIGGQFNSSWREDIKIALQQGCDIVSGLHDQLGDRDELAELAVTNDARIHDVRQPPSGLSVLSADSPHTDSTVILTVGSDCNVGKMTATLELTRHAQQSGIDAAFVPTGQTGVMIAGWGIVIDRVISDFAAGAVGQMVDTASNTADVVFVEGQGSIVHPAYSGVTTSILHGAQPDAMILCHEAGRDYIHGYEEYEIPPIAQLRQLYESLSKPVKGGEVRAGALNTSSLNTDAEINTAISRFQFSLGAPSVDLIREGPQTVLETVIPE